MSATVRRTSPTPQMDKYGLKFIRMIIASYCMGVGLGFIEGFDPAIVFKSFFDAHIAEPLGASVVLYCSILLFLGFFLRPASLYLAVIVLFSSISLNFFSATAMSVDAFWRDLVIACALLLNYWTLNERAQGRQSILRGSTAIRLQGRKGKIMPVRIQPKAQRRSFFQTSKKTEERQPFRAPLKMATQDQAKPNDEDRLFAKFNEKKKSTVQDDDVRNVFA